MEHEGTKSQEMFPPARDWRTPFDPPAELLRRLREQPISKATIWDGTEAWVITRYEDGRAALSDDKFSADPRKPGYPEKNIAYVNTIAKDRNIRVLDNPEHDIQKRMMVRDFTVKRVEEIRPYVQQLTNDIIDGMLRQGPTVDLVEHLASALPTMVICELLGVPYEERSFFGNRAKALLGGPDSESADEAVAAGNDLNTFLNDLIDRKTKSPTNDLMSRLVHEQMLPGNLERVALLSLCRLLLVAGHKTTAGMIGLSTLLLFRYPEAVEAIRTSGDPKFVLNAVDEMLRYLGTLSAGRRRVAVADVEIAGQLIRAGEGIIVFNNVMDRDETVFADAAKFDIRRANARANNAFGYGIHQCPGQLLARMELSVVHGTLWKRIPSLKLAVPESELRFVEVGSSYEVRSLPVAW